MSAARQNHPRNHTAESHSRSCKQRFTTDVFVCPVMLWNVSHPWEIQVVDRLQTSPAKHISLLLRRHGWPSGMLYGPTWLFGDGCYVKESSWPLV